MGGWSREWGLVLPAGNPAGITDIADLVDGAHRFVNRTIDSGLRTNLDDALAELAEERDENLQELRSAIDGFENTRRAHESPLRVVAAGDADVALGLRATAARLDLDFVSVGHQSVRVLAVPDRLDKPAFEALRAALEDLDVLCDDLAGYDASG